MLESRDCRNVCPSPLFFLLLLVSRMNIYWEFRFFLEIWGRWRPWSASNVQIFHGPLMKLINVDERDLKDCDRFDCAAGSVA